MRVFLLECGIHTRLSIYILVLVCGIYMYLYQSAVLTRVFLLESGIHTRLSIRTWHLCE